MKAMPPLTPSFIDYRQFAELLTVNTFYDKIVLHRFTFFVLLRTSKIFAQA